MTLEEYEKVLEEKRKALLALKSEERKVTLDKDFESMQLLSSKKNEEEFFVKLVNLAALHKVSPRSNSPLYSICLNDLCVCIRVLTRTSARRLKRKRRPKR